MAFGHDPHDGRHTGGQGSGNEIGRRKTLSFSLVVDRGVGGELGAGRTVDGLAVKLPLVADGNFYGQGGISPGRRRGSGPSRRQSREGT